MKAILKRTRPLRGEIAVEPDKSISHRGIIFSSLARGTAAVRNILLAEDTMSTIDCMRSLGIDIEVLPELVKIRGQGINGLQESRDVLNCGNSGTTMRLLSGLLSSQPFLSVLSGDKSLNRRPMQRVIDPLVKMGAQIWGRDNNRYAPLAIKGQKLTGIEYSLPVASAQIKTAVILAGLNSEGYCRIKEQVRSRDHSERMLKAMGANIRVEDLEVEVLSGNELHPIDFTVPGDISSAAFFIAAAVLVPGSEIIISQVGVNPTRSGFIQVMQAMGGNIVLENQRLISGEPVADLVVKSSHLKSISLEENIIPTLIDEIPVLAVAMALAEGRSTVRGAGELRVKESDRIKAICTELQKMGVAILEEDDGFVIEGDPGRLRGTSVESWGDHRIAMSLAIAAMVAEGETTIHGADVVNISFPSFWDLLSRLTREK